MTENLKQLDLLSAPKLIFPSFDRVQFKEIPPGNMHTPSDAELQELRANNSFTTEHVCPELMRETDRFQAESEVRL